MPELNGATVVTWLIEHGIPILIVVVVGAVLWFALNRFLPRVVSRVVVQTGYKESKEGLEKRTNTLLRIFKGLARVVIIIVVIIMVLDEVGVPVAPVLAGFGIAGVAVGFGAQYLIRDLIAGIFIIMENQYRVGDVVKVADIIGLVEDITLRRTVLRDLDGIVHHVPNGEIKTASNYTRHFSRVNLDISVGYGTDLDHAISVINRVGKELAEDQKWRKVIKSPPQALRVNDLGDSGIDIKILGDVKPMEQWAVMGELRLRLKKAFDAEGIEIPWPHTKVYFGNQFPDSPKKKA
jgi:small conductance mechanosensitive channel